MVVGKNGVKWIWLTGWIGITGVLLTIVSDIILLGRPTHAMRFLERGPQAMEGLSILRIVLGTYLGVFVLPFQLGGLYPIYAGLKPHGGKMPFFVVFSLAYALIMGVAFHGAYVFIGTGYNTLFALGNGFLPMTEMITLYTMYWRILVGLMGIGFIPGSLGFSWVILKGRTLFPKWMAAISPLWILFYLFPVVFILPAPVGGYIAPSYINLSTGIFILISLIMVLKAINSKKETSTFCE